MLRPISIALLINLSVLAAASAQPDPEDVVKYRQSIYQVIKWNFGELRGMLGGDQPYDAAKAEQAADFIASAAPMLSTAYLPGSITAESGALPKIWEEWDEFSELLGEFQAQAGALGAVDASDQAAVADALRETGGFCKKCHDNFKD